MESWRNGWLLYASSVIYFKYCFPPARYDILQRAGITFLFIAALSITIACSCTWLLEMLKEADQGRRISFGRSLQNTVFRDFVSAIPVAIVWTLIWFVLTVIELMLSDIKKNSDEDNELSAESAARTLAEYGDFSLSRAFIQAWIR